MAGVPESIATSNECDFLPNQSSCSFLFNLGEQVKKNTSEVIHFILDYYYSDFLPILKDSKDEAICLAITALGKVCDHDRSLQKHLNKLMASISTDMKYIVINIQRHLVSLHKLESLEQYHLDALLNLSIFLKSFQLVLPSSSLDSVSILLPLMSDTCEKLLKQHKELYSAILENLKLVDEEQKQFIHHHSFYDVKKLSEREKLHMLEPPQNFRSLPILPTVDDVSLPCLFLRPNITKGRYKDTEHYLDVQFRLLREDYIKPLRDGVVEYLNAKKKQQSLRNIRSVRVYTNVFINSEVFIDGDLLYEIHFKEKYVSQINWEKSKRLLTGNLLCLSTDDFSTMLFATVVRRDVDKLKEGLLLIKFEEMNETVLSLSLTDNFVVVEVPALFESYYHNLKALQLLNEESLPMKKYIVDLEKSLNEPCYLLSTTEYDMRPLFFPLKKGCIDIEYLSLIEEDLDAYDKYKSVTVVEDSEWPTASEINLDESQFHALKWAITKEFAIIQGPPGTGKTYIGLRTVQLLLHNISRWFNGDADTLPILVVCFTNHALDQFLEGILMLTKKIVRIGGRGSNENISQYQIRNLLRNAKKLNKIPHDVSVKVCAAKRKIELLKRQINSIDGFSEQSQSVISENILKDVIPRNHFNSLIKHRYVDYNKRRLSKEIIYDWLEISSFSDASSEKNSDQEKFQTSDFREIPESLIDEGEADIEFLESQRNIDCYNFNDRRVLKTKSSEKSGEQEAVKRKIAEYITNSLQNNPVMQKRRALKVKNIWFLPINERWQLYKFWVELIRESKRQEYLNLQEELKIAIKELADARTEEDLYVIERADVVGMTTTGAAKYRHIIEARNPVVLIVEEAAEILESHIVASLAPKTQHVILIGDQQQLRPSPSVYMLAVKYGMDVSLFERMINNGIDYCKLSLQHRMRPEIAALIVPHIYANLENHETVSKFENIKGIVKNVFFVNHNIKELHIEDSKSKVNDHEATFIVKLCKYLIFQGYDPSKITVLTTYSGQLFALKRLANNNDIQNVRFTVVDNFQGEENDIILISFVRSNDNGEVGFLKVSNRICVALSRAKKGLYCIGNFTLLEQKSKVWKNIIQTLNKNSSIGSSLRLVCQNHPDVFNDVASDTDFEAVPQGGCGRKCEYRLLCGHSCTRFCHLDDPDHTLFVCEKPCMTVCEQGHKCKKKCYEDCKPCPINVEKTLSRCGHSVSTLCGISEHKIKCQEPCKKTCEAGHSCPKKCYKLCGSCKVIVEKMLSRCNHTVEAECGQNEDKILCKQPCIKNCKEGHPCPKMCFEDCGSCKVIVDKFLSRCKHTVEAECGQSEDEILCKQQCIKICKEGHPCPKMCFEDCGSCKVIVEKFLSRCKHTVKAECGISEYSIKCQEACSKTCSKGHPCPKKCFSYCGSCEVEVDKTLQRCGHVVKARCSDPEFRIICKNKCKKTCSKGHLCQRLCYQNCGSCSFIIDRTLISCGHTVKAPCSKNESDIECSLKCKRILPCSHQCEKKCHEPCTKKCLKLVNIKLPKCEHSLEVECYSSKNIDDLQRKCSELCKEILPCGHVCNGTCGVCEQGTRHVSCKKACQKMLYCGHECVKKCCDPCTVQCMKIIQIKSPICKHLVNIECGFSNVSGTLSRKCIEPCASKLPCGHTCKGTCGDCSQGRLHVACGDVCNRILICGHKCASKCSSSCPPCEKPCENRCAHGKCPKKCGYSCLNCTKPCTWVCSHKKCTRLCYEVCDREPCNERCTKKLPCNHQCIGFCGEPCPKECIICNKNLLNDNPSVLKNGTISGYVYLEDCKHSFKQDYLDHWFTSNSSEMQRISMKTCPKCKTVIRRNFRFCKVLKSDFAKLEKIKQITKFDKAKNLDRQRNLLEQVNLLHLNISILYKQGIKLLSGGSVRNVFELTSIENILSIAKEIESKSYSICSMFIPRSFLETLVNYARYCREWMSDFISKKFLSVSEYQLQQLSREVHRLQLLDFLLKFAEIHHFASLSPEFEKCSLSVMTFAPFTDENVECFKKSVRCFVKSLKDLPLKYDHPLNVISMSGRWYQCLEGHIICVSHFDENSVTVCYDCKESTNSSKSAIRTSSANFISKNKLLSDSGTCFKDSCPLSEIDSSKYKDRKHVYKTHSEAADDEETDFPGKKYPSSFTRSSNIYKQPNTVHQSEKERKSNFLPSWRNRNDDSVNNLKKNNDKYKSYARGSRSLNPMHSVVGNENQLLAGSSANRNNFSSRCRSMPRHPVASSRPFFRRDVSENGRHTDGTVPERNYRENNSRFARQPSGSRRARGRPVHGTAPVAELHEEAKSLHGTGVRSTVRGAFRPDSKKESENNFHGSGRNQNEFLPKEGIRRGRGFRKK